MPEVGHGMRNARAERATVDEHARGFRDRGRQVVDDLEHVVRDDDVEGRVTKREPGAAGPGVATVRVGAARMRDERARGLDGDDGVSPRREVARDPAFPAPDLERALPAGGRMESKKLSRKYQ
jgi:hypothetical protein